MKLYSGIASSGERKTRSLGFLARTSTPSVRCPRSSSAFCIPCFRGTASICAVNPVIIVETDTWHRRGSTPANYTLKYNLMPFVGILTYGEVARVTEPIEFPLARERVE